MAKILSTVACILALWAVAAITGGATSSPSPPANLDECSPLIFNNLMDCMMFLSNEGDEDKPEQSCCSGLQKVVDANWNCVCVAISGSATIGMEINMTKAEALPAACGVSAPSVATCYDKPPTTPPSVVYPIHPPAEAPPAPVPVPIPEPISEAPVPSLHYHYAPATSPVFEAPSPSQHHHAPAPSPSSGASTIASIFFVISTVVFSLLFLA